MTRALLLTVFLVACGGSSATPADDAPPTDGAPGDDAPGDDAPPATRPEVLVPSTLGRVVDFAYTADAVYPILNIGGKFKLVRCPDQVCGAQPQVIGDVGGNTRGRGVEIVGDHIYWLANKTQLMEANLDGTGAHVRHDFLVGEVEPRLRGMDGVLYLMYRDDQFAALGVALDVRTANGPTAIPNTKTNEFGVFTAIDAHGGKVATWAEIQGAAAEPILVTDVATGQQTSRPSSTEISGAGLALGDTGVFFIAELTNPLHDELFACALADPCTSPPSVGNTFSAAAADGDRVFFPGRTADNIATIVTCDLASAAAGTCAPAVTVVPETELDLLNVRALRVDATAIYVATDAQGAGSLWKITR